MAIFNNCKVLGKSVKAKIFLQDGHFSKIWKLTLFFKYVLEFEWRIKKKKATLELTIEMLYFCFRVTAIIAHFKYGKKWYDLLKPTYLKPTYLDSQLSIEH